MAIYEFEGRKPDIDPSAYISKSADVIGLVKIGSNCFIAPGARIKGDYGEIIIGEGTSIQENCVLHARPGKTTTIGNYVSIGHGAIIHTATIHNHAVIGMAAIVSDFAEVGEFAFVGEGCLVPNSKEIPAKKVCVGVPAKIIRDADEELINQWKEFQNIYAGLGKRYMNNLKLIKE